MPIDSHLSYLEKHAFCPPQIPEPPHPGLRLVVVLPISLGVRFSQTLASLYYSNLPEGAFEIIAVVFGNETDTDQDKAAFAEYIQAIKDWMHEFQSRVTTPISKEQAARILRPLHIIEMPNLPRKHAGIGLARKIGMDEAVHRLRLVGCDDGIIVSFDLPNRLMDDGLERVMSFFWHHAYLESIAIPVEYTPLGNDHSAQDEAAKKAILEADLRTIGMKRAGHPYAFPMEEVGFAVRLAGYEAQDGMNRRKFGDIFAFLQKFIEVGRHGTCWETAIIPIGFASNDPKARIGNRIMEILANPGESMVFSVRLYQELADGLEWIPRFWRADESQVVWDKLPQVFAAYLNDQGGASAIREMLKYSRSREAFMGRFFRWMDSLRTLRFLEYCAEHHWPMVSVDAAAQEMREWITGDSSKLDLDGLYHWSRAEVRKGTAPPPR